MAVVAQLEESNLQLGMELKDAELGEEGWVTLLKKRFLVEKAEEVAVGEGVGMTQFLGLHFQEKKDAKADEAKKVGYLILYQH